MAAGELTRKQKRFIEEYCIDMNATRAAKAAGYSKDTAYQQGYRLLKNVEIKKALDAYFDELSMSTAEIIKRLTDWGRGSFEPFMHYDGKGVDLSTPKARRNWRLLKKIKHTRRTITTENSTIVEETAEIEIIDPKDAVVQLAKIRGLYGDKSDDAPLQITAKLEIHPASTKLLNDGK